MTGSERFNFAARPTLDVASQRAASIARKLHVTVLLSALIGVTTGLAVAGFDRAVEAVLDWVLGRPWYVYAVVPGIGLGLVWIWSLMWVPQETTTADAYVRAYHERGGRLTIREMVRKIVASAMSLMTGSAFGFEGPALLIGATVGSNFEQRFVPDTRRDDAKVYMVAGAAAGVAAIFKAPLTGVVFALEVPYRADLARRAMLPTLVAAGSSYVTFVSINGPARLFATGGYSPFELSDLGKALALGLACGLLARVGAWALNVAKRLTIPPWYRVVGAMLSFVVLAIVAASWFGSPLHLGPGYEVIHWTSAEDRTIISLLGLFAIRAIATWVSLAGGGVGGLFIPLVTQGAIVGALFQQFVPTTNDHLLPTIGIAAFLGAGYRTPLAGVAFVAEATGQPGFVVPALLAASTAQLVMGSQSFSVYQQPERRPELSTLRRLSVRQVMSPNPDTIPASMPVDEALGAMLEQNRRWAPVVDGGTYAGLLAVRDIVRRPSEERDDLTAGDVVRTDLVPVSPDDRVSAVSAAMRELGQRAVAVVDRGEVIGVVTISDLDRIELLVDVLGDDDV